MFHPSYRAFVLVFTMALLSVSCNSDNKTDSDDIPEETGEEFGFIGTKASPLDIEHWIQDGEGKFDHITEFEEGKVYIVEFWATWCGPCLQAMPHIVQLQRDYADRGVQVVSVSREPRATIDAFLQKPVPGQSGTTYGKLTKSYCLTSDPDGSVYKDYMEAAGQGGIPTAFIVGKTGRVEWVGHPMSMDSALEDIVENRWDRAAFGAPFKAKHESEHLMTELNTLLQNDESDEAIRMVDEAIAKTDAGIEHDKLKSVKWQILIISGKTEGLAELTSELLEKATTSTQVNEMAWRVFQAHTQNAKVENEVLQICADATHTAANNVAGPQKAPILDALAHLQHALGNLDDAIAAQTEAVALVQGPQKAEVQEFLTELVAEKGNGEKGNDEAGSDEAGSDEAGSDEAGSDEADSDEADSDDSKP